MFVALWFYGFVAVVAPVWMVPVMLVLWLALLVVQLRNFTRRPLIAFAMPFAAFALWAVIVAAGGRWLGWTA